MELLDFHRSIPTWENGKWVDNTEFTSVEDYRAFVLGTFKVPGEYDLDETSEVFNEQARNFKKSNVYCMATFRSKDFIKYWDTEKHKSRVGAIFKNNGKTWFLPRDYYFWINFLPIYDKIKKDYDFPQIWDVQLHMALYEELAEIHYKHSSILKKRQIASSYFHMGKLINRLWFDPGVVLKIGASLKDYINDNGSWTFLDEYKNFLNSKTAWYRPMNPDKTLLWQQKIEVTKNGRAKDIGLKGRIQGMSFEKSPTKGVGGPCHRKGTKILMFTGELKPVEDIHPGELIMGIDNKPKKVKNLFKGQDYIYEVLPSRGEKYYCTGDHTLYLETRDKKISRSTLRYTKVKDWNALTRYQKKTYVGKRNKEILNFKKRSVVTLDPYFLGLWLGDGYRERPGIIVNKTRDPEILEYLQEYSSSINTPLTVKRKEFTRYIDEMYNAYFNISIERKDTILTQEFVKYNLFYNKHIPKDFLYGSPETRLQLLAGYLDTDGYYDSEKGTFHISCTNDKLFNQVVFLARSLGAQVSKRRTSSKEHTVNNYTIKYTETNVATIRFIDPSIVPTKIKRKQTGQTKAKIRAIHTSPIKAITQLGIESYYGIEVEDNLYFLEDLTITHNCTLFFYEEAGIAPTMDKTYQYINPAMKAGDLTTGMFICAGSVGELKDCKPLEDFTLNPENNDIYAVETNLLDENGTRGKTGLFIPEQWGMPPYIDNYGNSEIEKALEALDRKFTEAKKKLSPEKYQLMVSQHPRNIKEALAYREEAVFPLNLVKHQKREIDDKMYPYELIDLSENPHTEEIIIKKTTKPPINTFPVDPKLEDKTGSIVVWERPDKNVPWATYLGSIDPVSEGKTTTSESLCSIYIYKTATRVRRYTEEGVENFVEGDKIVAAWCGRFDDINKTHERLRLLIEWYNAWTIIENNISLFIQYMIKERKQKFLVPKNQMLFLKEAQANKTVYQEYGWKNTGTIFKAHLLSYLIEFVKEVVEENVNDDGEITKKHFGIRRIPDRMAMVEMEGYRHGVNVDRLVTLAALIAFVKIQESNTERPVKVENQIESGLEKSQNLYKLNNRVFRNLGKSSGGMKSGKRRSPFKNIGR